MMQTLDRLFRWLALGLVGFGLVSALPVAWQHAFPIYRYALRFSAETPEAARERVLGPKASEAYRRLRREIPEDGSYILIDGARLRDGAPYWVRYQLAPRRALYLGHWQTLPSAAALDAAWPAGVRFAVLALRGDEGPVVFERHELLADLEVAHAAP
jgi:hypothetical protein